MHGMTKNIVQELNVGSVGKCLEWVFYLEIVISQRKTNRRSTFPDQIRSNKDFSLVIMGVITMNVGVLSWITKCMGCRNDIYSTL